MKTSVGQIVEDAHKRGESLESLCVDQLNLGKLFDELNVRAKTGGLAPDLSETDRAAMLVAAWFHNIQQQG